MVCPLTGALTSPRFVTRLTTLFYRGGAFNWYRGRVFSHKAVCNAFTGAEALADRPLGHQTPH